MSFDKRPLTLSLANPITGLVASAQTAEILVSDIAAVSGLDFLVGSGLTSGKKIYLGSNVTIDATGAVVFAGPITSPGLSGLSVSNTTVKINSLGVMSAGLVSNADVSASAAIALLKLAAASAAGQIIVANSSSVPAYVSMSGDATIDASGSLQITANSIVNADVSPAAAISLVKLAASGVPGQIIVANSSGGVPAYVSMGGDATIDASGSLQITANSIVNADVSPAAAILGTKISPDFGVQNISTTGTITNGTLTLTGSSITGLTTTPTNPTDAASKAYVDALAQGLDVKPSVRLLSKVQVTQSGAGVAIDSVSLVAGDRILCAGQTIGSQNGIFVVVSGGAWTRPTALSDMATGQSAAGAFMFIEEGLTYADTGWVCTSNTGSAVVGTNDLNFTQFSGAGSYTAANGVQLTGTVFSALFDGNAGIQLISSKLALKLNGASPFAVDINGVNLQVEASNPSLEIASNRLGLKINSAGGIEKGASGTSVKLNVASPFAVDINGVNLQVEASNPSLEITSNRLGLKINSAGGIESGASGTSVKLNGTTLALSASGLKFSTLPSQFQIEGSAVSSAVNATNLSAMVDGGILTDRHFHDSSLNNFTTDDTLSAGDPVYMKSNGNVGKALANDSAKRGVFGVAKANALAAATVGVIRNGRIDLSTTITVGSAVYLGDTGGFTATPPSSGTGVIRLGWVISGGDILVGIHQIT